MDRIPILHRSTMPLFIPGGFMDIELARTFLEITRCGSLAAAA